jgi:tRNA nucleotidyltransferase/poly(A) polymerase
VSENKSRSFKNKFPQLKTHSQWAATEIILEKLRSKGFECLLAGGAVRDLLIDRVPGDLDIATNAKPEQVENIFHHTVTVGKAFGVIQVIEQGHSIEVATYRKDLEYQDGRRPEGVVFTDRIEDAKRRDFTINALFYDPLKEIVFDDVNGKIDLDGKLIRAVGNPTERFQEDELRRLRLLRFVSQLGFEIEKETLKAVSVGLEGLNKISRERITEETLKMWQGSFLRPAFKQWLDIGISDYVDPEWKNIKTQALGIENIWQIPRQEKNEAWAHYFSFFFEKPSLKEKFKLFKLSRETEKFIESVHQAYLRVPQFLSSRKGEQVYLASQKTFRIGFRYYIAKKITDPVVAKQLNEGLHAFEQLPPLPQALVKAPQIQDRFQGPQLGDMLRRLYIEQLDQNWTTSIQALDWLAAHFPENSKKE